MPVATLGTGRDRPSTGTGTLALGRGRLSVSTPPIASDPKLTNSMLLYLVMVLLLYCHLVCLCSSLHSFCGLVSISFWLLSLVVRARVCLRVICSGYPRFDAVAKVDPLS